MFQGAATDPGPQGPSPGLTTSSFNDVVEGMTDSLRSGVVPGLSRTGESLGLSLHSGPLESETSLRPSPNRLPSQSPPLLLPSLGAAVHSHQVLRPLALAPERTATAPTTSTLTHESNVGQLQSPPQIKNVPKTLSKIDVRLQQFTPYTSSALLPARLAVDVATTVHESKVPNIPIEATPDNKRRGSITLSSRVSAVDLGPRVLGPKQTAHQLTSPLHQASLFNEMASSNRQVSTASLPSAVSFPTVAARPANLPPLVAIPPIDRQTLSRSTPSSPETLPPLNKSWRPTVSISAPPSPVRSLGAFRQTDVQDATYVHTTRRGDEDTNVPRHLKDSPLGVSTESDNVLKHRGNTARRFSQNMDVREHVNQLLVPLTPGAAIKPVEKPVLSRKHRVWVEKQMARLHESKWMTTASLCSLLVLCLFFLLRFDYQFVCQRIVGLSPETCLRQRPKTLLLSPPHTGVIFDERLLSNFTGEEVVAGNLRGVMPIFISILGHVFDVTQGSKHYGPDMPYHGFAGRDASAAFATGDFTPRGLKACTDGLSASQMYAIFKWFMFFRTHERYTFVGLLEGEYFDKQGHHTHALLAVDQAVQKHVAQLREKSVAGIAMAPACITKYSPIKGTEYKCKQDTHVMSMHRAKLGGVSGITPAYTSKTGEKSNDPSLGPTPSPSDTSGSHQHSQPTPSSTPESSGKARYARERTPGVGGTSTPARYMSLKELERLQGRRYGGGEMGGSNGQGAEQKADGKTGSTQKQEGRSPPNSTSRWGVVRSLPDPLEAVNRYPRMVLLEGLGVGGDKEKGGIMQQRCTCLTREQAAWAQQPGVLGGVVGSVSSNIEQTDPLTSVAINVGLIPAGEEAFVPAHPPVVVPNKVGWLGKSPQPAEFASSVATQLDKADAAPLAHSHTQDSNQTVPAPLMGNEKRPLVPETNVIPLPQQASPRPTSAIPSQRMAPFRLDRVRSVAVYDNCDQWATSCIVGPPDPSYALHQTSMSPQIPTKQSDNV